MPTFDFLCTACNHIFEFQRPFGSDTIPKCPACGSKKTEKQIAPPAIQFKGTGFYKTDSRSTSVAPKEKKDGEPSKPPKLNEPPKPNPPKKDDSKPK